MCRYALLCEFYRYLYESVKFRVDKLAANGVIFIQHYCRKGLELRIV